MLRWPGFWFAVVLAACVATPYVIGVAPANRRQWAYVAVTIAFAAWVLLLMTPSTSR